MVFVPHLTGILETAAPATVTPFSGHRGSSRGITTPTMTVSIHSSPFAHSTSIVGFAARAVV
jgi:hypothetical protein